MLPFNDYCGFTDIQIRGKAFQQLIRECLQLYPLVNLKGLVSEIQKGYTEFQTKVGVKYESSHYAVNEIQNEYFFHPIFGSCYTLDYKLGNNFLWLDFVLPALEKSILFLHEEYELPSISHAHILFKSSHINITVLEKRIEKQPHLKWSQCAKEHHLTCKDNNLHSNLVEKYGCKSTILTMGKHLKNMRRKNIPECSNMDLFEVNLQRI